MVADRIGFWAGICTGLEPLKLCTVLVLLAVPATPEAAPTPESRLSITSSTEAGIHFVYDFAIDRNRAYSLGWRPALTNGNDWTSFNDFTNVPGTGVIMVYTNNVTAVEARFYRVTVSRP